MRTVPNTIWSRIWLWSAQWCAIFSRLVFEKADGLWFSLGSTFSVVLSLEIVSRCEDARLFRSKHFWKKWKERENERRRGNRNSDKKYWPLRVSEQLTPPLLRPSTLSAASYVRGTQCRSDSSIFYFKSKNLKCFKIYWVPLLDSRCSDTVWTLLIYKWRLHI